MREIIHTDSVYRSKSHLSQAARWGDLVWTGGLGPLDIDGQVVGRSIGEQTDQCMANLRDVLAAAETGFEHVVKITVYLRRLEDFPGFEASYRRWIPSSPPPRCAVGCELGHPATDDSPGMDIEIEAVAGVPSKGDDVL